MEAAPLLDRKPNELQLIGDDGDYLPIRGLKPWWRVFCIETAKLWRIGGPIAFQILCQYGTNFVAVMFVGHMEDIELSAFSIAMSVVCTFSFGLMLFNILFSGEAYGNDGGRGRSSHSNRKMHEERQD